MPVKAVLRDGREVTLHPRYGQTVDDVVAEIGADRALLGSGAPSGVELETDAGTVPYADVNRFEVEDAFLG